MADAKRYGDRWEVLRRVGRGGQGIVYEVKDAPVESTPSLSRLNQFLREAVGSTEYSAELSGTHAFVNELRVALDPDRRPTAALKELLPLDDAVNPLTAVARMTEEVAALRAVNHPALIKVLDEKLAERWFVTEFFHNGPYGEKLSLYRGNTLGALRAFRPLVDATAALHRADIVHRDIKPDNIFIADSGHLVLGDCGLAIKLLKKERLTLTYENVGTRDYQPAWSYSARLQDVNPTFDVFSLGKLLWAMISGRPSFPLWYFDDPPHDLRALVSDRNTHFVHRFLGKCVVQHEKQCSFKSASEMLEEIDTLIHAIETGSQVPSLHRAMSCRFCGIGNYIESEPVINDTLRHPRDKRRYFTCGNCGHLEMFFFARGETPSGWG